MRIDQYLVLNKTFDSRTKAQNAIKLQSITVNGNIVDKPSFEVTDQDKIEVLFDSLKYVSRGGIKLESAIKSFELDFNDKVILDIGASTGGFTDCAIQSGAKLVYAVDVGTSQLAKSLKEDPRVISMEQTNILDVKELPYAIDFIVMDVSFISVSKIIPAINRFLNESNKMILLIKPQFEVGKVHLKNGIVKDKKMHLNVLKKVNSELICNNIFIEDIILSPIKGGSGNIEYLALVSKKKKREIDFSKIIN